VWLLSRRSRFSDTAATVVRVGVWRRSSERPRVWPPPWGGGVLPARCAPKREKFRRPLTNTGTGYRRQSSPFPSENGIIIYNIVECALTTHWQKPEPPQHITGPSGRRIYTRRAPPAPRSPDPAAGRGEVRICRARGPRAPAPVRVSRVSRGAAVPRRSVSRLVRCVRLVRSFASLPDGCAVGRSVRRSGARVLYGVPGVLRLLCAMRQVDRCAVASSLTLKVWRITLMCQKCVSEYTT
jgi:hypothetical protein